MSNKKAEESGKRLIIVGASGHGKVVADIALLNGYTDIVFLDDDESIKECLGFPVVGKTSDAKSMSGDFFVAIGNSSIRKRISESLHCVTLIHPKAVIGRDVTVGAGSVVMAGAVVNPGTIIGKSCIINTLSSVDHDCVIGDYSHIAVGAHICGTVVIGEETWIGAGATVINNISISGNSIIGAGATVVKTIEKMGIYVGTPAQAK